MRAWPRERIKWFISMTIQEFLHGPADKPRGGYVSTASHLIHLPIVIWVDGHGYSLQRIFLLGKRHTPSL